MVLLELALLQAGCDDPATPPRGPTDVLGYVLDRNGAPIQSAEVRIGSATAFTAHDGFFRILNVPLPYDLIIERPVKEVYLGLSHLDPRIRISSSGPSPWNIAYVTGRIPWQRDESTWVFLFGPQITSLYSYVRTAAATFLFEPRWAGPGTRQRVSLFLLRNQFGSGQEFDAYATRSLQISNGQRSIVDFVEQQFHPITNRMIQAEITPAEGLIYTRLEVVVPMTDGYDATITRVRTLPGQEIAMEIPVVPGLPLDILAYGSWEPGRWSQARVDAADHSSQVQVTLVPPAMLTAPTDSAHVSPDASLEWTDSQFRGVYAVELNFLGRGWVTFYTEQTHVSLTDVPFEDWLSPGTQCQWFVETLGSAQRLENLVVPPGVIALRNQSIAISRIESFSIESAGASDP